MILPTCSWSRMVVAAIEPALSKIETEQARRKTPQQLAAWDDYLRGLWHYHQFRAEEIPSALASFERAIALDDALANAHAAIARTLMGRIMYYALDEREARIPDVIQHARTALSLDSENFHAYCILSIAGSHSNDPEAGFQFAQRATQLNDNFAPAYVAMAIACLYLGQSDDGLQSIEHCVSTRTIRRPLPGTRQEHRLCTSSTAIQKRSSLPDRVLR